MKKFAATIATLMLAGPVAADQSFIYHGFEVNNPDLYAGYAPSDAATAVQPGIGDRSHGTRPMTTNFVDSYRIYAMDNPDRYSGSSQPSELSAVQPGIGDRSRPWASSSSSSDSYDAWVAGNPDQESGF